MCRKRALPTLSGVESERIYMRNKRKYIALAIMLVIVLGTTISVHGLDLSPTAPWRMAGDWTGVGRPPQMSAVATNYVSIRSTPHSLNNWNIIGSLPPGQRVDIVGHEVVRAWVNRDVSRVNGGPSRWINVQVGDRTGWVYIAFLRLE